MSTNCTLFVPVYNLLLTKAVKHEVQIGDVIFVSVSKLPYIRNRIGLREKFSEVKKKFDSISGEFFERSPTYAVIRTHRNKPDDQEVLKNDYKRFQRAFFLLASSQLSYIKRNDTNRFGPPEEALRVIDSFLLISTNPQLISHRISSFLLSPVFQFELDALWKKNAQRAFLFPYQKIISDTTIEQSWKKILTRSLTLVGQSILSKTLWEAFLFNMIAIETLLTNRGDKFPDAIIDRLITFFGWISNEQRQPWQGIVEKLYQKRCMMVHDGIFDTITANDVIESDRLVLNLLINLCKLTKYIKTKKDIFDWVEKYKAQRYLGKKITRPKNMHFIRVNYSQDEIEKLDKRKHWSI